MLASNINIAGSLLQAGGGGKGRFLGNQSNLTCADYETICAQVLPSAQGPDQLMIQSFVLPASSAYLSHCRDPRFKLPLEVPKDGTSPVRTVPRDLRRRDRSTSTYSTQGL